MLWFNKKKKLPLPPDDPTSIGNLLIESGLSKSEFIRLFIKYKKEKNKPLLGEFLVKEGAVKQEHVDVALIKQECRRNGGVGPSETQRMLDISDKQHKSIMDGITELKLLVDTAGTKINNK